MKRNASHGQSFEEGKKVLMKGVNGDKKAAKEAYNIFSKLRDTDTTNPLFEAYYGSTLTLLARDAVEPIEKADKAQEGLDALNRAISMKPDHKEIRLLRAKVCLRLPESYFHCAQTAIEDLSFLLNRAQNDSKYLTAEQVKEITNDLQTARQKGGK